MNKGFFIGNLSRDPEMRTTQGGIKVCNFDLAINEHGREETQFIRVTAWRALGEICNQYLKKGKKVLVTGAVNAESWAGADGQPRARITVTADEVEFLSARERE